MSPNHKRAHSYYLRVSVFAEPRGNLAESSVSVSLTGVSQEPVGTRTVSKLIQWLLAKLVP